MVQSVERALSILGHVATVSLTGEGVSLQSIAEHVGVAATTAHNLARTLAACGYLRQDERRLYHLGPRCHDLWRSRVLSEGLMEAAQGVVHALAQETGESVVFAVLHDGRRRSLLRAEGHAPVRVAPDFGEPGGLFDLVTGRVLAAYATEAELEAAMAVHGLPGDAWDGIASQEGLTRALKDIRAAGYAEHTPHGGEVWAVAVPAVDAEGRLLGALGLFTPAFRATPGRVAELRRTVTSFAARIQASA